MSPTAVRGLLERRFHLAEHGIGDRVAGIDGERFPAELLGVLLCSVEELEKSVPSQRVRVTGPVANRFLEEGLRVRLAARLDQDARVEVSRFPVRGIAGEQVFEDRPRGG